MPVAKVSALDSAGSTGSGHFGFDRTAGPIRLAAMSRMTDARSESRAGLAVRVGRRHPIRRRGGRES